MLPVNFAIDHPSKISENLRATNPKANERRERKQKQTLYPPLASCMGRKLKRNQRGNLKVTAGKQMLAVCLIFLKIRRQIDRKRSENNVEHFKKKTAKAPPKKYGNSR